MPTTVVVTQLTLLDASVCFELFLGVLTIFIYILGIGRASFAWACLAPTISNPNLHSIVLRRNSVSSRTEGWL